MYVHTFEKSEQKIEYVIQRRNVSFFLPQLLSLSSFVNQEFGCGGVYKVKSCIFFICLYILLTYETNTV